MKQMYRSFCFSIAFSIIICEGTVYVWLVYGPMLIPRQLRFSRYSGAVITEGLM